MTNFYPYYINTGLFEGFKPKLGFILPTLKIEYVIETMFTAIMAEQKEVYIKTIVWWFKTLGLMLPLSLRLWTSRRLVGDGMEHFVGRKLKFD